MSRPRPAPAPPPEAVLRAFAPREGQTGLGLPPGGRPGPRRTSPGPWWKGDASADPWRDPLAPATLGRPAQYVEEADQPGPVVVGRTGRRKLRLGDISLPVAVVAVLALLFVAALGGTLSWYLGRTAAESPLLTADTQLSEVSPGISEAPGSVASIAQQVGPAVVSIEVRVGDSGATGSGVVVDAENGYIVTNNHVVSGVPPRRFGAGAVGVGSAAG